MAESLDDALAAAGGREVQQAEAAAPDTETLDAALHATGGREVSSSSAPDLDAALKASGGREVAPQTEPSIEQALKAAGGREVRPPPFQVGGVTNPASVKVTPAAPQPRSLYRRTVDAFQDVGQQMAKAPPNLVEAAKAATPESAKVGTGLLGFVSEMHKHGLTDDALDDASDALEAAARGGQPLAIMALPTSPVRTVLTVLGSWFTGATASKIVSLEGGTPAQRRFAGAFTAAATAGILGTDLARDVAKRGVGNFEAVVGPAARAIALTGELARSSGRALGIPEAVANELRPGAHAPIAVVDEGTPSTVDLPPGSGAPETLGEVLRDAPEGTVAHEVQEIARGFTGEPAGPGPEVIQTAEHLPPGQRTLDEALADTGGRVVAPIPEHVAVGDEAAHNEQRGENMGPPAGVPERRKLPSEQVLEDLRDPEMVAAATAMKAKADAAAGDTHVAETLSREDEPAPVPRETPAAPPPGTYDRDAAQRTFVRFKTQLSKALNAKNWGAVLKAAEDFETYYESSAEPMPDDWARWQRAKEDAQHALARQAVDATSRRPPTAPKAPAASTSIWSTLDAEHQAALRDGLRVTGGAADRWRQVQLRGATDDDLREQLGQEFGLGGGSSGPGRVGQEYKGGKNPTLTLNPYGENKIVLKGRALLDTVREALNIPPPVTTTAGQPVRAGRVSVIEDLKDFDNLDDLPLIDDARPYYKGGSPNATSTPEDIAAWQDAVVDYWKAHADKVDAMRATLDRIEHEIRTADEDEVYSYEWSVEPYKALVPRLARVIQEHEGQQDLLGESGTSGPGSLSNTALVAAIKAYHDRPGRTPGLSIEGDDLFTAEDRDRYNALQTEFARRAKAKKAAPRRANPESAYAGDKLSDLLPQVEEEQTGRRAAIARVEQALADKNPRYAKRNERLEKERAQLQAEYEGTYEEVEKAAGREDADAIRARVEQAYTAADEADRGDAGTGRPAAGEPGESAGGPGTAGPEGVADVEEPAGGVPPEPGQQAPGAKRRAPRGPRGVPRGARPAQSGPDVGAGAGADAAATVDPADVAATEPLHEAGARGERPRTFRITDETVLTEGGAISKLDDNMAALRLLKQLQQDARPASADEQAILARYVGWGHTGLAATVDRRGADAIKDPRLKAARQELDQILTKAELAALGDSIINAHYSFAALPRAMWAIVQRLGFAGGTVLEPAIGTGHFFGTMPDSILNHKRTRLHGVEMEPIAAAIAQQLYQGAHIQHSPLQDATLPADYFDLVISNVPFGDVPVFDPRFVSSDRAFLTKAIHNYYFGKALDVVRPGGLIVFITSRYTLDAPTADNVRQYLGDRARLLGALRLPDTSFRKTAGTDVITDILVLQRHGPGVPTGAKDWLEVVPREDLGLVYDNRTGRSTPVATNAYYVAHPDQILGTEARTGKMRGSVDGKAYNVEGALTSEGLAAAVARFPEGVYKPERAAPRRIITKAIPDAKQGTYVIEDGKLYVYDSGALTPSTLQGKDAARMRRYIPMRDAYQAVLDTMLREGSTDEELRATQQTLKAAYEAFTGEFGPVNNPFNRRVLEDDPAGTRVTTLEKIEVSSPGRGKPKVYTVTGLADIFTKRTLRPTIEPTRADTAQDALVYSQSWRGGVDLPYMARLTGQTEAQLTAALATELYFDPATRVWVAADEYLSGDVVTKLAQAQATLTRDTSVQRNVTALLAVQPAFKGPDEFAAPFGATWVPVATYERFLNSIGGHVGVRLVNTDNRTTFYVEGSGTHEFLPAKTTFPDWTEQALNGQLPVVKVRDSNGTERTDPEATEQYRQALAQLREQWQTWWREDPGAVDELPRIYNALFNREVPRTFDGRLLVTPNANPEITLRPWQKNVVMRILRAGNTLIAHAVGAGKTYAMIAAAGEMKRLGLATKPMIVVPNHLVGQWQRDFMNFYPGARVLLPAEADFDKDRRKRLIAKIANNDWDAVIMAQSQFLRISVKVETLKAFVQEQEGQLLLDGAESLGVSVEEFDDLVQNYAEGGKTGKQRIAGRGAPRSAKDIARALIRLRERLQKRLDQQDKDSPVAFEQLGVDGLFVDESHLFKNLYFSTQKNGIVGLKGSDADRALDMFLKVRLINQASRQRNVVFATGTPVANTMSEVYTVFRYLAQPTLDRLGLGSFDAWANSFAVAVGAMEPAPGGGYKERTRLREWNNLKELSALFRRFSDVLTTQQLVESGVITLPKLKGGKPTVIALEPHPEMPAFMADLQDRLEALKTGKVDPREDNYLKVTGHAALAAVDLRLVLPDAPPDPNGRIARAAKEVASRYKRFAEQRGTQLVFLDVGTPKTIEPLNLGGSVAVSEVDAEADDDLLDPTAESEAFLDQMRHLGTDRDLYAELKRLLIAQGVKADEIAFIHQATTPDEQQRLFGAMQDGRIRVLLATTAKGGVGMNVQKRLVAMHHLDVPWRPADMEQREGRILRQGNEWAEVEILRYVTKHSFDEYRWSLLATKQAFIAQFLRGELDRLDDVDPSQLDMQVAAALASGDPRTLDLLNKEREITGLRARATNFTRRQNEARRKAAANAETIKAYTVNRDRLRAGAEALRTWDGHPPVNLTVMTGAYGYREVAEPRRHEPRRFETADKEGREGLMAALTALLNVEYVNDQPIGTAGPLTLERRTIEVAVEEQDPDDKWRTRTDHKAVITVLLGPQVRGTTPYWDAKAPPDVVRSLLAYMRPEGYDRDAASLDQRLKELTEESVALAAILTKTFDQAPLLAQKEREIYGLRTALGLEKAAPPSIEALAAELRATAALYHAGGIDHATFQTRNAETWKKAEAAKLTAGVQAALATDAPALAMPGRPASRIARSRRGPVPQTVAPPSASTSVALVPLLARALEDLQGAGTGLREIWAPASVSMASRNTGVSFRANKGVERQRLTRLRARKRALEVAFDRMPRAFQLAFAYAVDEGNVDDLRQQADLLVRRAHLELGGPALVRWTPRTMVALVDVARAFAAINVAYRDEANRLGGRVGYIEHYYPRQFLQLGAVRELVQRVMRTGGARRPLQGRAGFKKRRIRDPLTGEPYPLRQMIDGFGLEPVTYNPVTAHLNKWAEMQKWVAARRILREGRILKTAVPVLVGQNAPPDFERYPDTFGTIYGPPTVPVRMLYDPAPVEAIHRFLSTFQGGGRTVVKRVSLGRNKWGFVLPKPGGRSEMYLRHGGPAGVMMHELGHILDVDYGLGPLIRGAQREEYVSEQDYAESPSKVLPELRKLADLRLQGHEGPGFRSYVRQADEQIANLVHAYLYAPTLARTIAPNAYYALDNLVHDRPELAPLHAIQQAKSLRFEEEVWQQPVGGMVIKGWYYGPRESVRLLTHYLSPGIHNRAADLYRRLGNFMNQIQLGLSGFHAIGTGINAGISQASVALELIARGKIVEAAKLGLPAALATTGTALTLSGLPFVGLPLAIIGALAPVGRGLVRGHRLYGQYLEDEADFQHLRPADLIARAGGGVGWDAFWHDSAPERFLQAFRAAVAEGRAGHLGNAASAGAVAAWRAFPALVEAQAKPIMEWWVPRLKLAAFDDLVRMELADLGEQPDEMEVRRVVQGAWDSVDNRFGELIYDNLFWDNALKFGLMGALRAAGWNIGTVREIFGAIPAEARALGLTSGGAGEPPIPMRRVNTGQAPNEYGQPEPVYEAQRASRLAHSFAYVLALAFMSALFGAIYQFLHTGLRPGEQEDGTIDGRLALLDLYFPRTGGLLPNGTPERASLPTYAKDVYAFSRHPITTVENKLNPALDLLWDILRNEDYYGTEVHNPDDPLWRQFEEVAKFIAGEYRPITVRSFEQRRRGRESAVTSAESFLGINAAPGSVTRTPLEEFLRDANPAGHRTLEQEAQAEGRRAVRDALQAKHPDEARRLAQESGFTSRQLDAVGRAARRTTIQRSFQTLSLSSALRAYELASPTERRLLLPQLVQKYDNAATSGAATRALRDRYRGARGLPVAPVAAAAPTPP